MPDLTDWKSSERFSSVRALGVRERASLPRGLPQPLIACRGAHSFRVRANNVVWQPDHILAAQHVFGALGKPLDLCNFVFLANTQCQSDWA